MKSIRTRFLLLILSSVLLSSVIFGGTGILTSKKVVDEDSVRIMNLLCQEKTQELNSLLQSIEQSVRTLSAYAVGQLDRVERLREDENYVRDYTRQLELVAVNAANNTDGAVAVYVRYAPELTGSEDGLFWSRNSRNADFHKTSITKLSMYREDDVEHVGWYYIPKKNGKPTWLPPYYNKNINIKMISYVIPIYAQGSFVGVVGMDIDYSLLVDFVSGIKVYDSGYAFLTDADARVMYHDNVTLGTPMENVDPSLVPVAEELRRGKGDGLFDYTWNGQKKKMLFADLANGMKLAFTVPVNEIDEAKNRLMLQNITALILVVIISAVLAVLFTERLIKPLRELTVASEKIAQGDLGIAITCRSRDEVGILAESFRRTVEHLKGYISYINGLAYRDAMTGVKNKTAYQEAVAKLDGQIRIGRPQFAVIVLDINGLKAVNDNYGHDFGDMLIIDACALICRAFKHSPVFRIGGDEFVVLLEGADYERYEELLKRFRKEMEEDAEVEQPYGLISIAAGIAVYNPENDLAFIDVFKRADNAMYCNKADMKMTHG